MSRQFVLILDFIYVQLRDVVLGTGGAGVADPLLRVSDLRKRDGGPFHAVDVRDLHQPADFTLHSTRETHCPGALSQPLRLLRLQRPRQIRADGELNPFLRRSHTSTHCSISSAPDCDLILSTCEFEQEIAARSLYPQLAIVRACDGNIRALAQQTPKTVVDNVR